MKKPSFGKVFIVVGLLLLCVATLVVVYSTASEASVLLLEESFDGLDESKWKHEEADCKEDGQQFHYVTADEGNRLIADGVLHIYPNVTHVHLRTRREATKKCYSCISSGNSTADCIFSSFSANLQSKDAFDAKRGRVEIRAKICCGETIQLNIGITPNQNNSHPEEGFESFSEKENGTVGNNSEIRIFYESASDKTVMKSRIEDNEFHVYEINWDEEKVFLEIDKKKVDEKRLKEGDSEEENISNGTVKPDSAPISKPFHVNVGVGLTEEKLESLENHSERKRSAEDSRRPWALLEVDYIRIFKILN